MKIWVYEDCVNYELSFKVDNISCRYFPNTLLEAEKYFYCLSNFNNPHFYSGRTFFYSLKKLSLHQLSKLKFLPLKEALNEDL